MSLNMSKARRLTDIDLAVIERQADYGLISATQVRSLVAEVREQRALLAKIGASQVSMNVEAVFLHRFEAPWVFEDGEDRLSVAEVIRRQLAVFERSTTPHGSR